MLDLGLICNKYFDFIINTPPIALLFWYKSCDLIILSQIVPAKCRYIVMSTKIEIRLAKADSTHWTSLEFNRDAAAVQKANVKSGWFLSENVSVHTQLSIYSNFHSSFSFCFWSIENQKPTYPSSKPKRVDWDKLEAQMKKEVYNCIFSSAFVLSFSQWLVY